MGHAHIVVHSQEHKVMVNYADQMNAVQDKDFITMELAVNVQNIREQVMITKDVFQLTALMNKNY